MPWVLMEILPSTTPMLRIFILSQMQVADWLLILPAVMPWVTSDPDVQESMVVAFTVDSVGSYSHLDWPPSQVKAWPPRVRLSSAPRAWLSYSRLAVA